MSVPAQTNHWFATNSPITITTNVTVPAGSTLLIDPGTTVRFGANMRVIADGQVVAAGTPDQRIRLTRAGSSNWSGFSFNGNHGSNVFAYVDFEYANGSGNNGAVIYINDSQVAFDRDTFLNINGNKFMDIWYPQVVIRHSVFGNVGASYMFTVENINPNGWFIVDGNLFGSDTGDNDIFHLNHVSLKGGPQAIMVNNVFTGAGDDHIDDNETDTHIEGNLFMNFTTSHPPRSASCAVTTGEGSGNGHNLTTQHLTVVRNVFWGCDYGIINKDGSYVLVYNCVFVNNRGAIIFDEPWRTDSGPGRACYIESSIFWNNRPDNGTDAGVFAYLTNDTALASGRYYRGATQVTVNNSLLPAQYHYLGTGNVAGDPRFAFPTNSLALNPSDPAFANGFDGFDASSFLITNRLVPDLHLLPGSPALGTGFNGSDMGIYVADRATITGEPRSPAAQTNATLSVGGLDLAAYRYRVVGTGLSNDWSAARQQFKFVSQITLAGSTARATSANHGFANGDVVEVRGADSVCRYYNGTFTVTNVTADTFDYSVALGTNVPVNEPIMSYAEKRTDIWCRALQPVQLTGLADGTYQVEVVRNNFMGEWQDTNSPTVSRKWTVMTRPPQIDSARLAANAVSLRFYGVAGQPYRVQYTDAMPPLNWQTLSETPPLSANGDQTMTDNNPSVGSRFYRLFLPDAP
jgi:hypothetical protein